MIKTTSRQSGFTAIELLITLFVAAAFLIAAYQLFNVVVKDGGQARSESRAGNVAYDYMRRYSSSATDPCTVSHPLTAAPITVDGLSNVTVTVDISCLTSMSTSLSKIEVSVTYNTPPQTIHYSTYVNGTGSPVAVTDGLVAWWRLNGDVNSSVSNANGTNTNATPAIGQNGAESTGMAFNGSNSAVQFPMTNLPTSFNAVSVSLWAYARSSGNYFVLSAYPDDTSNGFNIGIPFGGAVLWSFGNWGNGLTPTHNAAWYNTWNLWTFTSAPGEGMKIYRNGSVVGTNAYNGTFTKGTKVLVVGAQTPTGTSYGFNGILDDLRIYNRSLSPAEISSLYSAGAQ